MVHDERCTYMLEKIPKFSLAAGWRFYAECEHFTKRRFNLPTKWSFAQVNLDLRCCSARSAYYCGSD